MDVLSRGLEASPRARGSYDDIAAFFMYKMLNFGNETPLSGSGTIFTKILYPDTVNLIQRVLNRR
jgi:hypothetical protein